MPYGFVCRHKIGRPARIHQPPDSDHQGLRTENVGHCLCDSCAVLPDARAWTNPDFRRCVFRTAFDALGRADFLTAAACLHAKRASRCGCCRVASGISVPNQRPVVDLLHDWRLYTLSIPMEFSELADFAADSVARYSI